MKRMFGACLAAALVMTTGAMAAQEEQQPGSPARIRETARQHSIAERMMPEPAVQLERLAQGLELTDQQQRQIRPILEDEFAALKKIRTNEDLTPRQIQKRVETLRNGTVSKVRQCLTPSQRERYDVVSAEIKQNKQQRMKDNRRDRIGTRVDPPAK